jgi:hypothetical protein
MLSSDPSHTRLVLQDKPSAPPLKRSPRRFSFVHRLAYAAGTHNNEPINKEANMQNSEQMVSTAEIQAAYIRLLNAAAKRQVTDDPHWWDRLPLPKTLTLRLPKPRHISEHMALELWRSVLEQKLDAYLKIELI